MLLVSRTGKEFIESDEWLITLWLSSSLGSGSFTLRINQRRVTGSAGHHIVQSGNGIGEMTLLKPLRAMPEFDGRESAAASHSQQ